MSLSLRQEQSGAIREDLSNRFFDETSELRGIAKIILTFAPECFEDAKGVVFKMFFTNQKLKHDGRCKKLDDAVRFKLKVDYFIILRKDDFDKMSRIEKARLLIHELHHMKKDKKGLPTIRDHNDIEDFCELPRHDLYSEKVLEKIKSQLEAPRLESDIEA